MKRQPLQFILLPFALMATLALASDVTEEWLADLEFGVAEYSYKPRETDTICPPEYNSTRLTLAEYVNDPNTWIKGPKLTEMAEDFGLPEISLSDFTLLTDDAHAEVCERLRGEYKLSMEKQARLFDGVEPEYVYDIAFYEAHGLYFVVGGGGTIIQSNPEGPGNERIAGGYDESFVQPLDADFKRIFGRDARRYFLALPPTERPPTIDRINLTPPAPSEGWPEE